MELVIHGWTIRPAMEHGLLAQSTHVGHRRHLAILKADGFNTGRLLGSGMKSWGFPPDLGHGSGYWKVVKQPSIHLMTNDSGCMCQLISRRIEESVVSCFVALRCYMLEMILFVVGLYSVP